jgi:hydroxyacylglutathione hydrolase
MNSAELSTLAYSNVLGYLAGGIEAWRASGRSVGELPQLSVHELRARLSTETNLVLVDVREDAEFDGRRVRDSIHIPFWALEARRAELPQDRPLAVMCEGGLRSSLGASLLARAGFTDVRNVAGGMSAWLQAGYPPTT